MRVDFRIVMESEMSDEIIKILDLKGAPNLSELGTPLYPLGMGFEEDSANSGAPYLGLTLNTDQALYPQHRGISESPTVEPDTPTQALEAPTAKSVMIEDLISESEYEAMDEINEQADEPTLEARSVNELGAEQSSKTAPDLEFAIDDSGDLIDEPEPLSSKNQKTIEPQSEINKTAKIAEDAREFDETSNAPIAEKPNPTVVYSLSQMAEKKKAQQTRAPKPELNDVDEKTETILEPKGPLPEKQPTLIIEEPYEEESQHFQPVDTERSVTHQALNTESGVPVENSPRSEPVVVEVGKSAAGGALVAASQNNDLKKIRIMIASGVAMDSRNPDGDTALLAAAYEGYLDIVEYLLDSGADMEKQSFYGNTPLLRASYSGREEIVKLLLERGASSSTRNKYGNTALLEACLGGHIGTVGLLLDHGASINEQDMNGNSPLIVAVSAQKGAIIDLLINRSADVNHKNLSGDNALIVACRSGEAHIVEKLYKAGADVESKDSQDNSALAIASRFGFTNLVELLINAGADVDAKNRKGHTPLMQVVSKGYIDVARLLLEAGANTDLKDRKHGYTALMKVCFKGDQKMAGLLLQNGADPDIQDKNGNSALMIAVQRKFPQMVEELLDYGADRNTRNKAGRCALDFAVTEQIKEMLTK